MANRNYYMGLLESRAKRLNELLEMAAPIDIICKEIVLLREAAEPLAPQAFWNYSKWQKGPYENHQGNYQGNYQECATG